MGESSNEVNIHWYSWGCL